ncbi:P-loop containing nucleoside triphosphate hydrolase protein [Phlyctochytrium arcticum]|nr:P-loop containing nucleoside triphosphate hydrolase protein [Phlyctochytrium arcticum]
MGLAFCVCGHAVIHHVVFFKGTRLGMQMRVTFITAIYRKCLALSISNTSSTGLIVNLVSNDVDRFENAASFAHYAWLGPVQLMVVLYLLYIQISWGAFAAVGSLLLVIPMQAAFATQFSNLRKKSVRFRDDRIKSVSDMLAGIMVVKLYAWEIPFTGKINELREQELGYIKSASVLRAINEALYFASSAVTSLFGFVTYFLIGGILTPSRIFTCLTYLSSVRLVLTNFFPKAIQFTSESLISLKRIEAFLSLPEIEATRDIEAEKAFLESLHDPEVMVAIRNGTFSWGAIPSSLESKGQVVHQTMDDISHAESRAVLRDINLTVRKGECIGVCGPVGSGKSSLANAILGEMECLRGKAGLRSRKVAYAAQSPWILTGSIRDNITFGLPFDEQWFAEVVRVCAMERDIQRFSHGIHTVIGERGVTLSGGQRARLALARAVYFNADIYILDDPLSAVDTNVGRHLFEQCIQGLLKPKAVILISHQLQYVRNCDRLVLVENGRISADGPYDQILHVSKTNFATTLREAASRPVDMDQTVDDGEEPISRTETLDSETADGQPKTVIVEDGQVIVPKDEDGPSSGEMSKEQVAQGTIGAATYYRYFRSGGGLFVVVVLCISLILGEAVADVTNWWLAHWSQQDDLDKQDSTNAWVFFALVVGAVIISNGRAILFFYVSWAAGRVLFVKMLQAVFRSPMNFFQINPHGRLMNRFSRDINLLDEMLPQTFFDFIQCSFMIIGTLVISVIIIPYILVLVPFIFVGFYLLRRAYVLASRQVKRIESVTRSPVYSNIPTTLEGLSTVRAFGREQDFAKNFTRLQNENTRMYFAFICCARWLGFRLDVGAAIFLAVVALGAVGLADSLGLRPGVVGLLLTYVLQLTGLLQWAARQSAEVENYMVSVERVLEYTNLAPEESPEDLKKAQPVPPSWPTQGKVEMNHMSLTYPGSATPVLKDMTLSVPPGAKVGIVGRTGAGKSSFLQALFRLVNPTPSGSITVDGIQTDTVLLSELRSRISIIPQEPFCFKGTLRFNIDPFGKYSDAEIWRVLEAVELKRRVVEGSGDQLESEVSENGSNWSVGERQLICLARAILRNTRLIVMDEATSAVDMHTDALIQRAIRDKEGGLFKDATVLTIAHRLNTVIDYDFILVLDDGHVVEYGTPFELLAKEVADPTAWFARMVSEMGDQASDALKAIAATKEDDRLLTLE